MFLFTAIYTYLKSASSMISGFNRSVRSFVLVCLREGGGESTRMLVTPLISEYVDVHSPSDAEAVNCKNTRYR